jgi:hypothetical protein
VLLITPAGDFDRRFFIQTQLSSRLNCRYRSDYTQLTNCYAVCPNILRSSGVNDRGLVIASPIVDIELGWLPSSDRFGGIVNFERARAHAACILFYSGKNDKVSKSPNGPDLSEVA